MTASQVNELVRQGAIFYVSHSGGKDSQLTYTLVRRMVPDRQIVVVHADLGKVEWKGVQKHIVANIHHPLNVVRAKKTFFEMVHHRARTRPDVPSFPSAANRQCTSDLKRGPIYKFIRGHMKAAGASIGLNVMGLRAEESPSRKKLPELAVNGALTIPARRVYNWLPIHKLTERQVFDGIRRAGQRPFWIYAKGNKRLSCVFCIFGCAGDIRNGREYRPELYQEYEDLQKETGWTLFVNESLEERANGTKKPKRRRLETIDNAGGNYC